jgi:HK97 family phage major capsid protein
LLNEGKDHDEAVAIAYSMCSETAKQAGLDVLAWDDLSDQQRAWWIASMAHIQQVASAPTTIKRLNEDRVGGYGMVWGSPEQRDLEGQYFTPETYLGAVIGVPVKAMGKIIKTDIDWLFDHTLEDLPAPVREFDDMRDYTLGSIDTVKVDEIGVWVEAQLKRHDQWAEAVMTLIDQGALAWSSGSAPLYAKVAPDGEIKAWPIIEWSSTPTPAEPRRTGIAPLKHFVNDQDRPSEATADQAARGIMPDIQDNTTLDTEAQKAMTLTVNETTARAMIRAYAESNFETIKAAVDPIKQGGLIEEALQPLAAELATIAGVEESVALAELVAFVAEYAAPATEEAPPESPEMDLGEGATLSADMQKVVDTAVAKAMQAALPKDFQGGSKPSPVKSFNIVQSHSRHDITTIKSMGDLIYAIAHHRHDLLNSYRAKTYRMYKALGLNPDTAGGYLAPIEQSNEVIELLRDTAKVLPLCRTIPMNLDTMTIPRQTGGATAYWIGENSNITSSEETFGQITLVARKLAARVLISNELMMDSDPAVEAVVREDIARVMALEVDRAILEGSGLGNEPLGLINLGITATALNAAPTVADLQNVISRIEVANVGESPDWTWVFNPREKSTLRLLQDARGGAVGTGAYIFSEMGADFGLQGRIPPNLLGYPWATTTQITPSGGNLETEMYFGQWKDVIVGMRKTLELRASDEAGTAFQNDQTWIRAIMRLDVNIRHAESIEVLTDVRTS